MQQLPPQQPQSPYYWSQPSPIQRPKRNRVVWWINGSIACVVLVVLVVIGYVLSGHSFSPSSKPVKPVSYAPYPTLFASYNGQIVVNGAYYSLQLQNVTQDTQGNVQGQLILNHATNTNPFTGKITLQGISPIISLTATFADINQPVTLAGFIEKNGSIYGYSPSAWAVDPT